MAALVLALGVLEGTSAWAGPGNLKSSALVPLYEEYAAHAARRSGLPFVPADRSTRVVDDFVAIDAFAEDDAQALVADVTALGMRDVAVRGRAVSGQLPLSAIPALDGLATLRFAAPSLVGRRVGVNTSQGDHAMRADWARTMFGVSGAGVKVGVLSDSFNCLGGADKNIADGDLSPVTVVQEYSACADGTDEGRAMLEIVHDVAPGAQLLFASGLNGLASFANNIVALKNQGANAVVDDLAYFSEPMFQDGILAQAVDTVVAQGVAYFSSTGNEGRRGYESGFRPGATFANGAIGTGPGGAFLGGVAHNFAPSGPADYMQKITIPSGRELIISLQWDSPFFSVSGAPGCRNDLDLYLLDPTGAMVVKRSVGNNVGGDAVEVLSYRNSGDTATFNLMILKFGGADPGLIKYVQLGSATISIDEFDTRSPTVFGHPAAAGAIAVGAAWYAQTPEFGVTPPRKESFSSSGPVSILFDTAGNRFPSPVIRAKPDIVAPDGGVTASVSSAFSPFFGTSAAAPHAAGVAALLLEHRPGLLPVSLSATLKSTAIDMATPGFDDDTGAGLIQADAALQFVSLPVTLGLTLDRTTVGPGDPLQVGISISNPGPALLQDLYFFATVPPALSASLGCPAGDALVFFANAFSSVATRCAGTASPQTFPPLVPNIAIAATSTTNTPNFVSTVWPSGLPSGTYTLFVVTTLPAGLADGVIGPVDIGAFAVRQFQAR